MRRWPRAVLLDLDDTILNSTGHAARCWREACAHCRAALLACGVPEVSFLASIYHTQAWFWADPERRRRGRRDLRSADLQIVHRALAQLGKDQDALASRIADEYGAARHAHVAPHPGGIDTLKWLRARGCRLALLTNGQDVVQREKLTRFGLSELFECCLIEGELGFGKPDRRIYELALRTLNVPASEAWMVGDNLETDLAEAKQMGMFAVWIDAAGAGVGGESPWLPDRIVQNLSELRHGDWPSVATCES
jgi:putative hydrolase of the HAD superfamily